MNTDEPRGPHRPQCVALGKINTQGDCEDWLVLTFKLFQPRPLCHFCPIYDPQTTRNTASEPLVSMFCVREHNVHVALLSFGT